MRTIATIADDLQAHRTQQLTESVGDIIDRRGPYNDTPGFGWLTARMGYFTQSHDRVEGRYAPVYENEMDLRAIRMAAWLMDEEVPVAKAMKSRLTDYTIASGFDWTITHDSPKIQSICRQIVKRFLENADWGTIERESFQREIVDGEFIAEFVADGSDISMEILEGDWLNEPMNPRELEEYKGIDFPACWTFGVLTRQNRAKPLAYHINRGGIYTDWEVVDAKEFVHWKRNVGRNPKRGFSDHYTTHKWLKYGDDVLSRTAQGTAIQASIAYIVEHAQGTTPKQAAAIASNRANISVETNQSTGQSTMKRKIGAGEVVDITNGAKYHASLLGSNASMIYIEVMESLFRLSGTVYAFPENFVTGYAGNNNMASSIEAKMPFVQGRYADQAVRANRTETLLLNVIRFGLKRMPSLGITFEDIAPGLVITISPPEIVSKDPAELTAALTAQAEKGWISDHMAIQELGRDYDDVKKQLKEEAAEKQAAGQVPGQAPMPGQSAPGATPATPDIDGSMSSLSRRQFTNNKKAIFEILNELKTQAIDQSQASVMLSALGLSQPLVDKLLGEKQEQLTESWDEAEHPRDREGKFVSKAQIANAALNMDNPNLVDRLVRETEPHDLPKLQAELGRIGGENISDEDWEKVIKRATKGTDKAVQKAHATTLKGKKPKKAPPKPVLAGFTESAAPVAFVDPKDEKAYRELIPDANISPATLIGAPDNADVDVQTVTLQGKKFLKIGGYSDDLVMSRSVFKNSRGELVMSNNEIESTKPGLGRQAFRQQVEAAQAAGVTKIVAAVAGDAYSSQQKGMDKANGYYTWARYGYNAPIRAINDQDVKREVAFQFPKARTILDIMETQQGRDWWRENGSGFTGEFDLTPGSRSLKVFNAYLKERGE